MFNAFQRRLTPLLAAVMLLAAPIALAQDKAKKGEDRKSTRLNSSH